MAVRVSRFALLLATLIVAIFACTPALKAEPRRPTGSATDEVRWHLDQVLAMAQTPSFRAASPERRRDEVRRVAHGFFNWTEMSRRALGPQWNTLTVAERREFARGLGTLAEHAYIGQVEQLSARGLPREPVRYGSEWTDDRYAIVRTTLMYPQEMPVDFWMARRGAHWEVHDVWIDGVSAAQNYGAQARRIMANGSFHDVVDRMIARSGESSPAARATPGR